jgi:hypothetical protein
MTTPVLTQQIVIFPKRMRRSSRPKKPPNRDEFVFEQVFIDEACKRSKSRPKDTFYYPATCILRHKVSHGELLYYIEWADGSPSTWETEVSQPALTEYLEELFETVALLPEGPNLSLNLTSDFPIVSLATFQVQSLVFEIQTRLRCVVQKAFKLGESQESIEDASIPMNPEVCLRLNLALSAGFHSSLWLSRG